MTLDLTPVASPCANNQAHFDTLRRFIGFSQLRVMLDGTKGEEGQYFADKLAEFAARVEAMPVPYDQEVLGEPLTAHLHYFRGGMDWYIAERDCDAEQNQAWGAANLGFGGEMGYISIAELIENGVELDLHFKPTKLVDLPKAQS